MFDSKNKNHSSHLTKVQLGDGHLVLDPTANEESQQTAIVTVAFMPSLNEVTQLFQDGELEYTKMQEVNSFLSFIELH